MLAAHGRVLLQNALILLQLLLAAGLSMFACLLIRHGCTVASASKLCAQSPECKCAWLLLEERAICATR